MGQKEKAREIASSHEFRMAATTTAEKALAEVERLAKQVAPGGMKGSLELTGQRDIADDKLGTTWHFKPKGQIGGKPALLQFIFKTVGPDVLITLQVETFAWQKGSFGMKPQFPGGKQLDELRDALARSLEADVRPGLS